MTSRPARRSGNRRRRTNSAADYMLEVTTKSASARRRRRRAAAGWVLRLFLLVLLGYGAYHGARAVFDRFFYSNPDYTLRAIDLELGGVMTREEALAATGLQEGVNIFAVDLAKIERVLSAESMVKEVRIERMLPDRLAIRITAREPVAWVASPGESGDPSASPGALLTDSEGILMRPRRLSPEHLHLPVIQGVQADNIREGAPLDNEDLKCALGLLDELSRRSGILLRARSLDISRGYRIDLVSDQNAVIQFATSDFPSQLDRLQKLLNHCVESGREIQTVNLMVKRNTPVTFVMAAAPEPQAPGGKKRRN